MEIKSLTSLKKDLIYDLYTTVLIANKQYSIYSFVCTNRHAMRIDLVCYDIYENTDNIDILCNINNIYNMFTINAGDIILFASIDDLDDIRSNDNIFNSFFEAIKNANKGKEYKTDKNRIKDVSNRVDIEKAKKLIMPNIVQNQDSNLSISNGKIIMKPNF